MMTGCLYGGGHVRHSGKENARDAGGFRDGRGEGHEERWRCEYLGSQTVEVGCLFRKHP